MREAHLEETELMLFHRAREREKGLFVFERLCVNGGGSSVFVPTNVSVFV